MGRCFLHADISSSYFIQYIDNALSNDNSSQYSRWKAFNEHKIPFA